MGQKVNAHGNRVGIIKDWDTKWYADKKNFATNLKQDDDIRKFIKKNYYKSAISKITIERAANKVTVNIHTGRPATIIGKQGIFMRKGYHTGTFIPQVADEVAWTKEEFLGHCAQDKAGIGWDGWKTAELYTYEAIVF